MNGMRLLWPLWLLVLSGCSALSAVDNTDPPAELVELESQLEIHELWSRSFAGPDGAFLKIKPALAGDRLYLAEPSGRVLALEASTGKELWSVDLEVPISGGPGVNDGLLAVGTEEAELILLNAADGSERWRKRVNSEVLSVPAIGRGKVICRTIDGRVSAFSTENGESRWVYDRSVPVLTLRGDGSPVLHEGQVLVGFANGKLVALSLDSGAPNWEALITAPTGRTELERVVDIDADLELVEGTVYAAAYHGQLAAVSEISGIVLWQREISSHAGLDADWRQVFITDEADHIWSLDATNGATLWQQKALHARRLTAPVMVDGYLVVGDFDGYLHWFSQYDGQMLARYRVGSDPVRVRPQAHEGILYVLDDDGTLSALRAEPRPSDNP
jgi:outer membrane protein assembly factor BamB